MTTHDTSLAGHPKGLSSLFFTEMWERFSFYGMRAIFVPFMMAAMADGGLAFSESESGSILALYMSMVYMMALPGGWVADKFLGQRRAVFTGGLIIMLGHILLAVPAKMSFYLGLVCLVLGTGFLKPNVSTMVGQLYARKDPRRDGGFSIFYMGINVGAFVSPIICGWLAQSDAFKSVLVSQGIDPHWSWHFGFAAAAVGMGLGLAGFAWATRELAGIGAPPVVTDPARRRREWQTLGLIVGALVLAPALLYAIHATGIYELSKSRIANIFGVLLLSVFLTTFVMLYLKAERRERHGVAAMFSLAIGCIAFFALFEQAAGTMNAFAADRTDNRFLGTAFPSSWFQSVNPVFIILLSPIFAWFFTWIVRNRVAFNDIRKFAVALVIMASAFLVMIPAAKADGLVSPMYLVMFYLLSTVAELFLSPVGLSSMSKLAPAHSGGLVMGVWFLSTANGDYIAGRVHGLTGEVAADTLFLVLAVGTLVVAGGLFAVGTYFTRKVPLESLHVEHVDASGKELEPPKMGAISGYAIAGFATSVAVWPVVLTDPQLGLVVCIVLGTAAVAFAVKGLLETSIAHIKGRGYALAALAIAAGAFVMALVKVV